MPKKELKKLRKNLVQAVDWAAAEYQYLQKLKEELRAIEHETEIKKELKDLRKAAKILRYVSRAERRASQFEERVGRELIELLPELAEEGISAELILGFRDVASGLRLEHDQLVKLASFYEGTLEEELDQAQAEAKLEEKLREENPAQAAHVHQAFLELLHHFSSQIDEAEQWIAGLEATLKKGKELFLRMLTEEEYGPTKEGITILKKYGFPVERYPHEAFLLAQNGEGLRGLTRRENTSFLFSVYLPRLANEGFINERTAPEINKIIGHVMDLSTFGFPVQRYPIEAFLIAQEGGVYLFQFLLPFPRFGGGEMVKRCLSFGLPGLIDAGILTKESWPMMAELAKKVDANCLLMYCLPALAKVGIDNKKLWWGLEEMTKTTGGVKELFRMGVPTLVDAGVITKMTWPSFVKNLPKVAEYCKGVEEQTYNSLAGLANLFNQFGMELFDLLIFPTLKRQSVASFFCFRDYKSIAGFGAVKTKEDIDILIKILSKRKFKAHDLFQHLLIPGLDKRIVASPLTTEKEFLLPFLDECSVDLLEVYEEYKRIVTSTHPEKGVHLKKLFKDLKTIQEDIFSGVLTKEYEPRLFLGILYNTFSPELTVPRETYQQIYDKRSDRQEDIPKAIQRFSPEEVKISTGGYALREGETIDDQAWRNLVEVVAEVHSRGHRVVPELLGLALLEAFATKTLFRRQREFLKDIYAFAQQQGAGLPEFTAEHATLMKYKEFVGDRLKNDLIAALVNEAYVKRREEFVRLMQKLEKPKDMSGLAKQIFGLWLSPTADKGARITAILERNGIHAPFDVQPKNWQEVNIWLQQQAAGTISKNLISDMFAMLIGEDYSKMQKEMEKFEHSHEARGTGGTKFLFMLSKRKVHSVAMFNMGVCVAPDEQLWNASDFWQLIIWDENFVAHGGVVYRTIMEGGKKYLVLSINPASSILSQVSPVHLYEQITAFSEKMRRKLDYDQVLIPTSSVIHSNRGSIQAIISQKNYPKKTLRNNYQFSYSPYSYSYQEFFMVG